jgi:hypothetical protein
VIGVRIALSALLFCTVAATASAATDQVFASRLTAVAYDGAMRANVQGDGHISATLNGNKLSVTGNFSGLPSPATAAALYSGPGIGVPGMPMQNLTLTGQSDGTVSGTVTLNAKQLAAFRQGHVYVQINSQKAPDGNLWGWLLPDHAFPGANVPEKGHGFLPQLDVPGNWVQK